MMSSRRYLPRILSTVATAGLAPALLISVACGGGGSDDEVADADPGAADGTVADDPDAMPLSQTCLDAADHSDLAWIQDNILTPGCSSFAPCHKGPATQAGRLNLESGNSETAMLGVDSVRFGDWKLVVAGDPANSYLMVLLTGEGGPIDNGIGTMPYNNPLLCEPKIEAIRRWITAL